MDMITNQNSASITGTIASPYYQTDYKAAGSPCYKVFVDIRRLSGTIDTMPVIVPESRLEDIIDKTGCTVSVKGTFRSANRRDEDGKRHLDLFIFADEFTFMDEERKTSWMDENHILLDGYITKVPVMRVTPLGKRKIADVLLAVNSPDPKHPNYIPCIMWGRNAYMARRMKVGDYIRLEGRAQSREYDKHLREGDEEVTQKRIAYEISCFSLEMLKIQENQE